MKKFIQTIFVLVVALIPMFTIFAFAGYDYNTGDINITLSAAGNNTQLCSVKKCAPEERYGKVKFKTSSTFNKANVWIMNSEKKWMSDKVEVLPNGKTVKIPYTTGITFTKGASVVFWGEQYNIASKKAVGTAYGY